MIPSVVHLVYGWRPLAPKARRSEDAVFAENRLALLRFAPLWSQRVWQPADLAGISQLVDDAEVHVALQSGNALWTERQDLVRLVLLFSKGGFVVDVLDMTACRDLSPLRELDILLVPGTNPSNANLCCEMDVVGARPGDVRIGWVMREMARFLNSRRTQVPSNGPMHTVVKPFCAMLRRFHQGVVHGVVRRVNVDGVLLADPPQPFFDVNHAAVWMISRAPISSYGRVKVDRSGFTGVAVFPKVLQSGSVSRARPSRQLHPVAASSVVQVQRQSIAATVSPLGRIRQLALLLPETCPTDLNTAPISKPSAIVAAESCTPMPSKTLIFFRILRGTRPELAVNHLRQKRVSIEQVRRLCGALRSAEGLWTPALIQFLSARSGVRRRIPKKPKMGSVNRHGIAKA